MRNHLVRSLLLVIPTVIGVTMIIFLFIRLIPGDAVTAQLTEGSRLTEAQVEEIRVGLGLDQPVHIQYLTWVRDAFRGDFGRSFVSGQPVVDIAMRRLPLTIELAFLSIGFAIFAGVPIGVLSALKQDQWSDQLARFLSISSISVPSFVLGTLFVLLTSIWFRWQPPPGFRTIFDDVSIHLQQTLPAAITSGIGVAGITMRLTRSAMLNVLKDDFVRTSRSKGLRESAVVWRHALPNAMIPIVSITSTSFALLLGGAVIVESIFTIPGLGLLTVQAITARDYPQIMMNVLLLSMGIVVVNFLSDLLYASLDPRIRFG